MSERQPYSRVYWSVMQDPKFDRVRGDMRAFGAWSLMLIVADMAYPSPAFVPPTVPKKALELLVEVGLVDLCDDPHLYRVHGLETERKARAASATRPHPKRDAVGSQDEDETRTRRGQAEPSRAARVESGDDDPRYLQAWWAIGRHSIPSVGQQSIIDSALRNWDVSGDERIARIFLEHPADPIGALKAELAAWRKDRADEARKAEAEAAASKRSSKPADAAALAAIEARYREKGWDAA